MRSIFLIGGLIVGGFGGWMIAQLSDSGDSSDQVLTVSAGELGSESTQPPTETTVDGQEDPTATTLATDSDPDTTTTTTETISSSTTTTTLATEGEPATAAEETPTTTTTETPATSTTTTATTTEAPNSDPGTTTTTTETPPTTTTTEAPESNPTPAAQETPTTTTATTATPAPDDELTLTTTIPISPPSTAIQLAGCRVPWDEGVRCVVARGVNHEPGEYGIEETEGSWSCTIELPELRSSESFGYMICPPVETVTDLDGTRSYVPPGNRRLYGLDQVQEIVDQLDDCQMRIRNVNLPISVQTEEGVAQVERPAIEHILHCVLRQ